MNIYSNSCFHRVNDWNVISLIIKDGFKCFYCKEEIYHSENQVSYIGIPMVCFCDIPLTFISNNNYGRCEIGMSRKWGRSKSLEPVLYYPNDKRCQSTMMVIQAAVNFGMHPEKKT